MAWITSTTIREHEATVDQIRRDLHGADPHTPEVGARLDRARQLLTEASRELEAAALASAAAERELDAHREEPEPAFPIASSDRRRDAMRTLMSRDAHPEPQHAACLLDREVLGALSQLRADRDDTPGAPRYPAWCIVLAEAGNRWPEDVSEWIAAGAPHRTGVEELRARIRTSDPFTMV